MTKKEIRTRARKRAKLLVSYLFCNGQGEQAERLKLVRERLSGGEVDIGGWCRGAVEDRAATAIEGAIYFALRHEEKRAKKGKPSGEEG